MKPLRVVSFEDAILTLRAPTGFIGDWVKSHYTNLLITVRGSVGNDVKHVQMELSKGTCSAHRGVKGSCSYTSKHG